MEQKTSLIRLQVSLILPFLCFRAQIRGEEDVLVMKPGRNVAICRGKLAFGVEEEVWITGTCLVALISRWFSSTVECHVSLVELGLA